MQQASTTAIDHSAATATRFPRWWAYGGLLLALLMAVPPRTWIVHQEIDQAYNLVDGSWRIDFPMQWADGQIAGRDFAFTYGPLYQLTHSLGVWLAPTDDDARRSHLLASVLRYEPLLEPLLCVLLLWSLLGFVGASPLRRGLFLPAWVLLVGLPRDMGGVSLKPFLGVWLVGWIAFRLAQHRSTGARWLTVALAAAAPPFCLLYSFELGVVTFLALMVLSAWLFATAWRLPQATSPLAAELSRSAAWIFLAVPLGALTFVLLLRMTPWRNYLVYAGQIASSYTIRMAYSLQDQHLLLLVAIGAALLMLCVGITWYLRKLQLPDTTTGHAWMVVLATGLFSLLWLRYGLTRSDPQHICLAILPALFLAAGMLPPVLQSLPSWQLLAWALTCLLVVPLPSPRILPYLLVERQLAWPRAGWGTADLQIAHPLVRRAADLLAELPPHSVYIWPYETIIDHAAGKRNPAITLQSYSASNRFLEEATMAELDRDPELPVLLIRNSAQLDTTASPTRTSRIFRHLLENYTLRGDPDPEFALLRRRTEPAQWIERALELPAGGARIEPDAMLQFDTSDQDIRASDPLVLTFRTTATRSWGYRKPGVLVVQGTLSDGTTWIRARKLMQDGEPHLFFIAPLEMTDPMFISWFARHRLWRATERLQSLTIGWVPLDRLSVRPAEVWIEGLAVLERPDAQVRESSLADQQDPELQQWSTSADPAQ
jgi:hypothetical protein